MTYYKSKLKDNLNLKSHFITRSSIQTEMPAIWGIKNQLLFNIFVVWIYFPPTIISVSFSFPKLNFVLLFSYSNHIMDILRRTIFLLTREYSATESSCAPPSNENVKIMQIFSTSNKHRKNKDSKSFLWPDLTSAQ